jgi:hypothetical protein
MNDSKTDREHALKELAAQLMFDVQKNGSRFSLRRDSDLAEPFQSDDLTLEAAEELLNTWKLRGFHGG